MTLIGHSTRVPPRVRRLGLTQTTQQEIVSSGIQCDARLNRSIVATKEWTTIFAIGTFRYLILEAFFQLLIGTSTTLRRFVSKRYNASSIYSTMKQSYQLIKLFTLSITKNIWVCLTASGVYMYMETSSPRTQGDRARIDSIKAIAPATGVCVRFWYHMYGAGMGSLTMHTGDDNGGLGPSRWSRTGDSGQMWREALTGIGNGTEFQVRNWKNYLRYQSKKSGRRH